MNYKDSPLNGENIKELVFHDGENLIWLERSYKWVDLGYADKVGTKIFNIRWPGKKVGSLHKATGYLTTTIFDKDYRVHVLVWLYFNGKFPENMIDHKDRNRSNNDISNLRVVDNQENQKNRNLNKNNTSGHKGISWCEERKKWQVYINVDKFKRKGLGRFETLGEALAARDKAEIEYNYYKEEENGAEN